MIIEYIVSFVIGIFNSYYNGIKEGFLFGGSLFGPNQKVYDKEAVTIFLSQAYFQFGIISMVGILPSICIPIFVVLMCKFQRILTKDILKYGIIVLLICIILHIISFLKVYDIGLILLPYIECIIISYFIARKIYRINNENMLSN